MGCAICFRESHDGVKEQGGVGRLRIDIHNHVDNAYRFEWFQEHWAETGAQPPRVRIHHEYGLISRIEDDGIGGLRPNCID
jgi:hypothetical protein